MRESKSRALPLGDTPMLFWVNKWGERWESNPRPPGPQSGAPPIELLPPYLFGATEGIRTPDTRLRRAVLYPAELQSHLIVWQLLA